jgi:prepilin-type processing-associated H-X9-DG protein
VGDYGGNHGDLSPGAWGGPTDFYYGGNGTGIVISSRARCERQRPVDWIDRVESRRITDGLSKTILAGEMFVPPGMLGQAPLDAFIFNGDQFSNAARIGGPTVPITGRDATATWADSNALMGWGSWHAGVCHFAFADGSVHSIANGLDTEILALLSHRADRQAVNWSP